MTIISTAWVALDDAEFCSFHDLQNVSGLSAQELSELIDIGAIVALDAASAVPALFSLRYVAVARTARHLRDDFELDQHGIALAMTLLSRIDALQQQLATARAGSPVD